MHRFTCEKGKVSKTSKCLKIVWKWLTDTTCSSILQSIQLFGSKETKKYTETIKRMCKGTSVTNLSLKSKTVAVVAENCKLFSCWAHTFEIYLW